VLKVDFGVHANGRITDSAFTLNFEPTYDKLIEAVKAATETGVRVFTFLLSHFDIPTIFSGSWNRRKARGARRLYTGNDEFL